MAKSSMYHKGFFEHIQPMSRHSATALIPIVLDLIRPTSVIDVGCGTGEFLAVVQKHGVSEILGIDGEYVERSQLVIPQENFMGLDISTPFSLERTFDLALCLEVAEHLAPARASDFIESLSRLAPVILFSAAIPLQGGYGHLNEQWPEYWAQLFKERGFVPVDALRKRIWSNCQIEDFYRQNVLLFCTGQALASNATLEIEFKMTNPDMLSIVHPELYMRKCNEMPMKVLRPIKSKARKILRK